MKIRITFQETVCYEATIDLQLTPELADPLVSSKASPRATFKYILETPLSDGEPLWFHLLEAQCPNWATERVVSVDDRDLTAVYIEDEEKSS